VEDELPLDAPRRSTVVFRRDTRKFAVQQEENIGCFAKFCRIFGIGKKKEPPVDDDYMSFNNNEVL